LRIDLVSIFPQYFAPLDLSIVGRAQERGLVQVYRHDLRDWAVDRHRTVDDTPYGGGPGMVMRADVWGDALDAVIAADDRPATLVIPTPSGQRFKQSTAAQLAGNSRLVFACGRYEGIDSRVVDHYASRLPVLEVSVVDAVLAGGEVAAVLITESVVRLLPGVLGNEASAADDSFAPARQGGALEGPVYTRPPVWRGMDVPDVLLSGDHGAIARWRAEQSRQRTQAMRPDLLEP
jgi:tRNA (guanine37-N1)-methyltransferase